MRLAFEPSFSNLMRQGVAKISFRTDPSLL